jgi:hypothetical protein
MRSRFSATLFPTLLCAFALAVHGRRCAAQALVPFGDEFRVNTYSTGAQADPAVAMNGTGQFVVVWSGSSPSEDGLGIFGQRFDAGGAPVGPEFRVNTYTTGSQDSPAVAIDDVGDFIVVWRSVGQDGDLGGIYGRLYDAVGAPGSEFRVNFYTSNAQDAPSVSKDSTGSFIVTWTGTSGVLLSLDHNVVARRYTSKGAAVGTEFLVNSYTTGSQSGSAIAAAGSTFVVVFSGVTPADHDGGIGAQRYDATLGPLGGELAINSYTSASQTTPSVAIDTHGSFLVTWASAGLDDDLGGVSAQRFSSAGVPRGSEFRVNSVTTSAQKGPRTAVDAGGTFVIVWDSQAAGSYDVVARTMKNGGALQGDDVAVNAFTTGTQIAPDVAGGPAGSFVVVWRSDNQASATSSSDIYARLLRPSGDADGNGLLDVNDVFYLINYLFAGGPPPLGPANPDGIGGSDILDVFYLINFLFAGGPAPV